MAEVNPDFPCDVSRAEAYTMRLVMIMMLTTALLLSGCGSVTPLASPNLTGTSSQELESEAGSTQVSLLDGMVMVYVPEGEFTMGLDADVALTECQKFRSDCQQDWFTDGEPLHTVFLSTYWIDQTEVTNGMYAKCVTDGACQPPDETSSYTRSSYYGDPQYDDHPVIFVSWSDAQDYCAWAGRRLPTEAEWEKAARGTDERLYPWGDSSLTCSLAIFLGCSPEDTMAVGSFPSGASPYGALDMAGNVWEWVADWYGEDYYSISPASDPSGPTSGEDRIVRGGSWDYNELALFSTQRGTGAEPSVSEDHIGFRCACSP